MNNNNFLLKDENIHLLNRGISDPLASISVKGGIFLNNIANLIGVKLNKLKELNQHIKKNILPSKKNLYTIYIPYSKLSRYNLYKNDLYKIKLENYQIKAGDTLSQIAKKYGINYKTIKKQNKLKSNKIKIGQFLMIPTRINISQKEYIVKLGDTLSKIALKYKVNMKNLMKDNNIKTSMIKIGDKIVIKYK
jgi:membrane-bound lytic murein transglycosylase D